MSTAKYKRYTRLYNVCVCGCVCGVCGCVSGGWSILQYVGGGGYTMGIVLLTHLPTNTSLYTQYLKTNLHNLNSSIWPYSHQQQQQQQLPPLQCLFGTTVDLGLTMVGKWLDMVVAVGRLWLVAVGCGWL